MKQPYCPCEVPGTCQQCLQDRNSNNGCRGFFNAFIITICIVLLLLLCTRCNKPERLIYTPGYTVDKITIDSVQYIIANGTGTAIIKHEPGAIKE